MQIAGVALNSCVTEDSKKAALNDLNGQPDEKFKKICNLLYSQNLRVNLFKEFDVNELFEVTILSVNPKFRGQGIAKQLLIQSEQIARDNGFRVGFLLFFFLSNIILLIIIYDVQYGFIQQVMKSDATGLFSQRVQTSLGFKPCLELRYDEYCDENKKPIFVVEPPHEVFQILYKYLDDDENVTSF